MNFDRPNAHFESSNQEETDKHLGNLYKLDKF